MAEIADLGSLIAAYDGFLLDQFGVLHDGERVFEGVVAALERLRGANKPVLILSNSGKRAAANTGRLEALGIPSGLYTDLVTSGEAAWRGLKERVPPFDDLGRRVLFVARGGDRSAIAGLDLQETLDPNEADFVLLAGLDGGDLVRERVVRALDVARTRGLPLVCTNPDLVSLEGERRVPGPGAVARRYAEEGGEVRYVGKPHAPIFQAALDRLGLHPQRLVMIGDSLDHDIKGAAAFNIAGALVLNGVHAKDMGGLRGEALSQAVERLAAGNPLPRHLLPAFGSSG